MEMKTNEAELVDVQYQSHYVIKIAKKVNIQIVFFIPIILAEVVTEVFIHHQIMKFIERIVIIVKTFKYNYC